MGTTELVPVIIGGKPRGGSDGATIDAVNPATGEVIAQVPAGTAADVADAVSAALSAYQDWRRAEPGERAAAVTALAGLVDAHAGELADLDIVSVPQLEKVLGYIELGKREGSRLVTGGTRLTSGVFAQGNFVRPAVFAGVDPGSRLAQEEIFGPVLATMPFTGYDALRIANGVRYGLTASVFTRDLATAHRFARDVEAGYVWVNEVSQHVAGAGFGGVKDSGLGREENIDELTSYTQSKNVHVNFDS